MVPALPRFPRRRAATALALVLALAACAAHGPTTELPQGDEAKAKTLMQVADETRAGGDPETAASLYRQVHDLTPKDPVPLARLATTLVAIQDYRDAALAYRLALALTPDDYDLHRGLALALLVGGDNRGAMAELRLALAKHGDDPRLYSALGVAQDLEGRHDLAQQSYRHGLELAPGNASLSNNYAMSLAIDGKYAQAVAILGQIAGPESAGRYRLNLAMAYGLAGDDAKAAAVARELLDETSVQNNLAYYALLRGMNSQQRTNAIIGAELHGTPLRIDQPRSLAAADAPIVTAAPNPPPVSMASLPDLPPRTMGAAADPPAAAAPVARPRARAELDAAPAPQSDATPVPTPASSAGPVRAELYPPLLPLLPVAHVAADEPVPQAPAVEPKHVAAASAAAAPVPPARHAALAAPAALLPVALVPPVPPAPPAVETHMAGIDAETAQTLASIAPRAAPSKDPARRAAAKDPAPRAVASNDPAPRAVASNDPAPRAAASMDPAPATAAATDPAFHAAAAKVPALHAAAAVKATETRYLVQLGCWMTEAMANKIAERVNATGIAVSVTHGPDKSGQLWYVVRSGEYASADEADAALRQIAATGGVQPILVHRKVAAAAPAA